METNLNAKVNFMGRRDRKAGCNNIVQKKMKKKT